MHDVFVSYSKEDRSRVERLVRALEAEGWSVYWDTKILAGEAWHQEIARELASARCVIVAWSARSVASHWVRDEATQAHARGALVPVLIDAVPIPLGFGQIHTIAIMGSDGALLADGLPRLVAGVRRLAGPPPARAAAAPAPVPNDPDPGAVAVPIASPGRAAAPFRRWLTAASFPIALPALTFAAQASYRLTLADVALAWLCVVVGAAVAALAYRRLSAGWIDRRTFSASLVSAMAIPAATLCVVIVVLYLGPVMWRGLYALIAAAAGAALAFAAVTLGWTVRSQPVPRLTGYVAVAAITWFTAAFVVATTVADALNAYFAREGRMSGYFEYSHATLHLRFLDDLLNVGGDADVFLFIAGAAMTAVIGRALLAGLRHQD